MSAIDQILAGVLTEDQGSERCDGTASDARSTRPETGNR